VKRSLLVEADGGPLAVVVAGANVPDAQLLEKTIEAVVLERPPVEEGWPQHLCLDKGYDNEAGWGACIDHEYEPHIALIRDERSAHPKPHKPRRWVVERVRHEAPCHRERVRDPLLRAVAAARRSWGQPGLGGARTGGSSPDNDGAGRHCQTAWVRQARRSGVRTQKPVLEPPQATRRLETWWIWAGQQCMSTRLGELGNSVAGVRSVRAEATAKSCGVAVARLQGNSWTPIPSNGAW
jgi:hypothetical protein